MAADLKQLEKQIEIKFNNLKLLKQAFTHSSYVNEHRNRNLDDNERLEFLGDAVLELAVSGYLYQKFPDMREGNMTKLRAAIVCETSLVEFAEALEFSEYVLLGKGEELTGGRNRPALLADVFESFVGALYLDQGFEVVKVFLDRYVFPRVSHGDFSHNHDYKSQLQEFIQHDNMGSIEYIIVNEIGPAHDREFHTEVVVGGDFLGQGVGRSKKESEQKAAHQALIKLSVIKN